MASSISKVSSIAQASINKIIQVSNLSDAYSVVLMHMDTASFLDEKGKTVTVNGVSLDTTNKKFGDGSALSDGIDDELSFANNVAFNWGSGDWTIDFWFKRGTSGVYEYLFGRSGSDANNDALWLRFDDNNKLRLAFKSNVPTLYYCTTNTAITDTNFHHSAIVRYGNNMYMFLDGTQDGTRDMTGITLLDPAIGFAIFGAGVAYGATPFKGNIDEFRISKGIARWTGTFTPSTSAYSLNPDLKKILEVSNY